MNKRFFLKIIGNIEGMLAQAWIRKGKHYGSRFLCDDVKDEVY